MANTKLIKRLVDLRESKNWSQAELARRINRDNSIISKIESGKRDVKSEELIEFANLFDVSTDYLLGKSNNKHTISDPENDDILTMYKIDTRGLSEDEIIDMREELEEYNDFMTKRLQEKIAKKKRK